jgi:glycosyltransferase involved in cell wall biosynthesis
VKVLHVHRIAGIGGSERHLLTLLPALAERGVEAAFAGLDLPAADPFYAELRRLGIAFERLANPLALAGAVRRFRPELLHTHLVHADVYGAIVPRIPIVSTKHNPDPFRTGPWRFVERGLARRARRLIAISEALKRFTVEHVGVPPAKIAVVHYGLDELPRPWAENTDLDLPVDARVLLCVARLVPQKGVDVAVKALPAIRAEHPDAVLVVLGEGPQREELRAEGVYLPGRVGDIAAWYRRAELLVHPARWEGFGIALLEAMLAGKPIVATRISAAPEIVDDGVTGLLVPPEDPAALAAAVNEFLADPLRAAAYGRSGLVRARAEFSVAGMAERTAGVYDSL